MARGIREPQKGSPVEFVNERRRVDVMLVERGVFESRAKAKAAIEAGLVTVDGAVVRSPAQYVAAGAELNGVPAHPWVGRGGVKLDHALTIWAVPVEGRVVLDVGASTGGFTQVCLSRGARRVYAVDVGRGQLHPTVSADPRVVDLSSTDARRLTAAMILDTPELVVADVSFISLTKALPTPLSLASADADLVVLVKPQFELEPGAIGAHGIVWNPADLVRAQASVAKWLAEAGWPVRESTMVFRFT